MSILKKIEDERRRKDERLARAGTTVAAPMTRDITKPLRIDPRKAELLAKARADRAAVPSHYFTREKDKE